MIDINFCIDGQCMSYVNLKEKKIRRCLIKNKNSDFCIKHFNKKMYYSNLLSKIRNNHIKILEIDIKNINEEIESYLIDLQIKKLIENIKKRNNYLDNNNKFTLLNLYDSWNEVKFENQILIGSEYWDINILSNHLTYQLNNSNMENPYPIYPNNPFNRIPFVPSDLLNIKEKLIFKNEPINITLKLFLNQNLNFLNLLYIEALKSVDRFSFILLNLFQKKFRFMIFNNKNSQNSYNGIWVKLNHPITEFENLYENLKNMPYQIIDNGYVIYNYRREQLQNILLIYPKEIFELDNEKICEII